jgi:hypothetical protein
MSSRIIRKTHWNDVMNHMHKKMSVFVNYLLFLPRYDAYLEALAFMCKLKHIVHLQITSLTYTSTCISGYNYQS